MAADKLVTVSGGIPVVYTPATTGGGGDANKVPALDSNGQLTSAMMPSGIGASTETFTASETLAAGDFVNIWNDAGTLKARKADASSASAAKRADGFVIAGVSSAATATVYRDGFNNQLSGLTVGDNLYLSTTVPGGVQSTAPTTTGHLVQYIGKATSTSKVEYTGEIRYIA